MAVPFLDGKDVMPFKQRLEELRKALEIEARELTDEEKEMVAKQLAIDKEFDRVSALEVTRLALLAAKQKEAGSREP